MKKISFLYLFLCLHFSLNAQKKNVDFFSLPFVQEAKTLHDFELKNISGCSLFYAPDINLYVNADFNGDFEDNFPEGVWPVDRSAPKGLLWKRYE